VRAHSGHDFGLVASGTIEMTVGDEIYDLKEGDSFAFLGLRPHRLRNKSGTPAELLWVTVAPQGS
jgi:mannose-6-phosphate isomerase-like protein (cupin superfamily)